MKSFLLKFGIVATYLSTVALSENINLRTVAASPDKGQMTNKGCECAKECHASVDFQNSKLDYCFTKGRCGAYSWTRGKFYDYCDFSTPDAVYEDQTASAKLDFLWAKIRQDSQTGKYPAGLNLANIFVESVITTFQNSHDTHPAGRRKYTHSVGTVAKAKFVATEDSPFTGVFKGTEQLLIRFANAKLPVTGFTSPAMSMKFLIDGVRSTNFGVMPGLDDQPDYDVFRETYTNHPVYPEDKTVQTLLKKFSQASGCPCMLGISEAASFNVDGSEVSDVVSPYEILFKPTAEMPKPPVNIPINQYDLTTYIEMAQSIPAGTHLFEVFGFTDTRYRQKEPVKMGDLYSTSEFVTSKFGDNNLSFRHVYMEEDFKKNPQWLYDLRGDMLNMKYNCGTDEGPLNANDRGEDSLFVAE